MPYGVTTTSLIESILKANDKGKIKVKRVEDNTADKVEVVIHLTNGVSPDRTIDALYAFTDCEVRIAPNACVIEDDKPVFLGVKEILKRSADRTRMLLGRELEIRLGRTAGIPAFRLAGKDLHREPDLPGHRGMRDVGGHFEGHPHRTRAHIQHLIRPVTDEDVTRLTEIRIKRISKFDSEKADQRIANLEVEIDEVKNHLAHLTDYTVEWYRQLKKKFGKGRERKTVLKAFGTIDSAKVAVANHKLYADLKEGFVGINMPRGEGVHLRLLRHCRHHRVSQGWHHAGVQGDVQGLLRQGHPPRGHLEAGRRADHVQHDLPRRQEVGRGRTFVKRFNVTSMTRDKVYPLTKGTPGSQVLWFSANPNGEAEQVTMHLSRMPRLKSLKIDVDFSEIAIKGRGAAGNTVTKYTVTGRWTSRCGSSTLGARQVWFDESVRRLNGEGGDAFLGAFGPDDRMLVVMESGAYELLKPEMSVHFPDDMIFLDKWHRDRALTVVHLDGEKKAVYVKRFMAESSTKTVSFIGEEEGSKMLLFTDHGAPIVKCKGKDLGEQRFSLNEFIAVKGVKARGKRLSTDHRAKVVLEDTPDPTSRSLNLLSRCPPSRLRMLSRRPGQNHPHRTRGKPADGRAQSTLF